MTAADPRYPDDGLAELVDELEYRLACEAYPRRYLLGFDGSLDDTVVLAERVDVDGAPWLRLEDLERRLTPPPLAEARRYWLNSWPAP